MTGPLSLLARGNDRAPFTWEGTACTDRKNSCPICAGFPGVTPGPIRSPVCPPVAGSPAFRGPDYCQSCLSTIYSCSSCRKWIQGTPHAPFSWHSTSSGLSHGNHTGMGFSEKQGAGNSMVLQVPGIQTEARPILTQGRMLNSVLISVGQIGRSNGIEMGPTLSGGMGRSGTQVLIAGFARKAG